MSLVVAGIHDDDQITMVADTKISFFDCQGHADEARTPRPYPAASAGVPDLRENGCHALRHFFASTALHEGESIKAVSEHLGHADPGFTLRTYTHLMEGS